MQLPISLQTAIVLLVFSAINVSCANQTKIVQTSNGPVRGSRETSPRKRVEFHAFRGIPYARPPLGDLRFKVKCFELFIEMQ